MKLGKSVWLSGCQGLKSRQRPWRCLRAVYNGSARTFAAHNSQGSGSQSSPTRQRCTRGSLPQVRQQGRWTALHLQAGRSLPACGRRRTARRASQPLLQHSQAATACSSHDSCLTACTSDEVSTQDPSYGSSTHVLRSITTAAATLPSNIRLQFAGWLPHGWCRGVQHSASLTER